MTEPANDPSQPEPSLEQLRMAYRHMARPGWPSTLEAALQVHHYRICITGLARRLGRPAWAKPAAQPAAPQPSRTRLQPRQPARPQPMPDRKRLAANDRDD